MSQFAAPATPSGIDWSDLNGRLLIIEPAEVVNDITTNFGPTSAVRARVQQLIDHGHGTQLARQWSQHADVPTFKQGGPTSEHHIDLIAEMCAKVEADIQAAFGPSDPAPKQQKEPTA
jgi:hypothetical protein